MKEETIKYFEKTEYEKLNNSEFYILNEINEDHQSCQR